MELYIFSLFAGKASLRFDDIPPNQPLLEINLQLMPNTNHNTDQVKVVAKRQNNRITNIIDKSYEIYLLRYLVSKYLYLPKME